MKLSCSWRLVWRWARLLIGLGLLALLLPLLLAPDFWETLARTRWPLVALALLLSAASVASKAWRWGVVMRWRGIALSPGYLLSSYWISMFFNHFLPSGLGGDAVRALETAHDTGRGAESVVGVIIERGSGMLAVFAAGSLGALAAPGIPAGLGLLAHGLFLGSLVGIGALWSEWTGRLLRRVGRPGGSNGSGSSAESPNRATPKVVQTIVQTLVQIHDEFRVYRHKTRLLRAVMLQSILTLGLTLASIYSLLLAFDAAVPFAAFAVFLSVATAIDVLPFSLNSLGVREGTYVFFLGLLGVPGPTALGVALLVRLLVLIQAVIGGLAFARRAIHRAIR